MVFKQTWLQVFKRRRHSLPLASPGGLFYTFIKTGGRVGFWIGSHLEPGQASG